MSSLIRYSLKAGCILALLLMAAHVAAHPSGYDGYQVVEITATNEVEADIVHDLQQLGADFQVWSEVVRPGLIEVRVSPEGRAALEASGLHYEVTVADLQVHLEEIFAGDEARDFFDSLRSYNEVLMYMGGLAAANPDIASLFTVGMSVQFRPLRGIRITGPGETKVGVMFHGAEHGNEAAGASIMLYIAQHLLENYGTDPEVTALVDGVDWYILPIMNPDGYVAYDRWNANGVDLNRNWDGPGAGEDPWGGPYPFSEPETQAMRDFFLDNEHVRLHLDLHGYVPWIMWPWAHTPSETPEHDMYYAVGAEMRDRVADAGGGYYDIGTIYNVAYPVSGCSSNYTYGVLDRWAFAVEVVNDDMPEICEEFLEALVYLGEWIQATDCNGNGVLDLDDIANGTSQDANDNGIPDECEQVLTPGDLDCDGDVDFDDIDPFVLALSGQVAYEAAHPNCYWLNGDTDGDGDVDFDDINGFVQLIGS